MKCCLILLAVACAAQLAVAAPSDKVDCAKLEEIIDEMGAAQGMTVMNDNYKLPTTVEEFSKRCTDMTEAIKTLRKYNKECYSSLTQQVFSAILRTRSQFVEARCKADSAEMKEAAEASKCIVEKALESVKEAEKKAIVHSQVLFESNIADEKLRMRRSCCGVVDSRNDFINAAKSKCPAHEKLYTDYVDSYTSEAMSLICPEADKLECSKLEALKTDGVQPKSKFFLNPMLKLVKTLDH